MKICILGASGFLGTHLASSMEWDDAMKEAELVLVDRVPLPRPIPRRAVFVLCSNGSSFFRQAHEALGGTTACVNLASPLYSQASCISAQVAQFLDSNLRPIHDFYPLIALTLRQWIQVSSISVYANRKDSRPLRENDPLSPPIVNGHPKVYQFWESKSVPPDGVEHFYAGKVDTISPPSLEYDLLKP